MSGVTGNITNSQIQQFAPFADIPAVPGAQDLTAIHILQKMAPSDDHKEMWKLVSESEQSTLTCAAAFLLSNPEWASRMGGITMNNIRKLCEYIKQTQLEEWTRKQFRAVAEVNAANAELFPQGRTIANVRERDARRIGPWGVDTSGAVVDPGWGQQMIQSLADRSRQSALARLYTQNQWDNRARDVTNQRIGMKLNESKLFTTFV